MTVEEVTAPAETSVRPMRTSGVVASLTGAKVLGAVTGFITGPIQARALGPAGRGDLAAITVPVTLAPAILGLGMTLFAYRELPKGRSIEEVVGSVGVPMVAIGLLCAAAAVPVADALAGGREVVRTFLIVGFLSMPVLMFAELMSSSLGALQRWRALVVATLIPFLVPFVAIVALSVSGHLTVGSAAVATIAGSVFVLVPGLSLLRRRPIFRVSLARRSISYGMRAWLGGLAQLANLRLDQVLMITAVSSRELGLYAVAVTFAGAPLLAIGSLAPPLMSRVAAGETNLVPRAVRMAIAGTVVLNLAVAAITPSVLSLLFGSRFSGAIPMTLVLLAANVPYAGAMVLGSALQADGAPLVPSVAEGLALVVTVAGLVALLGPLQGIGAAIVSLAAYGTSFCFQLIASRRRYSVSLMSFLAPTRSDLAWARAQVAHARRR